MAGPSARGSTVPIAGNGLFAAKPIEKGEPVIIFGGTAVFTSEDVEAGRAKKSSLLGIGENLWLGDRPEDPQGPDYSLTILATLISGLATK